jgi:uncharacterized protein (DUF2141 family)
MTRWALLATTVWLLLVALPAGAGELRITVKGIRSTNGVILIGLYDSAESFDRAIGLSDKEGFLNDPLRVVGAALRANLALKGGVVFSNLEPDRYAIIVFHDENSNGRLDKNVWGVPTEPYGFSNGARGKLGPPKFDDAAITLDGSDTAVVITLIYHGDRSAPTGAPRPAYRSDGGSLVWMAVLDTMLERTQTERMPGELINQTPARKTDKKPA